MRQIRRVVHAVVILCGVFYSYAFRTLQVAFVLALAGARPRSPRQNSLFLHIEQRNMKEPHSSTFRRSPRLARQAAPEKAPILRGGARKTAASNSDEQQFGVDEQQFGVDKQQIVILICEQR